MAFILQIISTFPIESFISADTFLHILSVSAHGVLAGRTVLMGAPMLAWPCAHSMPAPRALLYGDGAACTVLPSPCPVAHFLYALQPGTRLWHPRLSSGAWPLGQSCSFGQSLPEKQLLCGCHCRPRLPALLCPHLEIHTASQRTNF